MAEKKRTHWKRHRSGAAPRSMFALSEQEQNHVKTAIAVLRVRHGGLTTVARLLNVNHNTLERSAWAKGKPSVGLALRVARLLGVPTDDVLAGRFPWGKRCPVCGRGE